MHVPDVIVQAWPSLLGCRHCRSDADVVAREPKFGVFVKKHPSHAADVVARAHVLPPGRRRRRSSGYPFAWVPTVVVAQQRLCTTAGVVALAGPVCAQTSQGIKGPAFPSLLTLLRSEASWPGLALQQLLARTSRIGLWLSFVIVLLFM